MLGSYHEFILGPLQWRSASVSKAEDLDIRDAFIPKSFNEQLQALINQALKDGCTSQELTTILRQHIPGDPHVDA
jgi:hypothetical protein